MREANFAPVYCSLYPEFAEIARKHGYALAIHGSLAKDMDLVAIPWTDSASEPQAIVDAIVSEFSITQANGWTTREHGRQVTTLVIAFGDCFVDLSFVPRGDSLSRSPALAAEAVAYTHPDRLKRLADGKVQCETLWSKALVDDGDIPLYIGPQPAQTDARVGLTYQQVEALAAKHQFDMTSFDYVDSNSLVDLVNDALRSIGQAEPRAEVTHGDTTMGECMASLLDRLEVAELYADRYRYLRERPLDAVSAGGVFAGKTPDNVVLNGADLDAAVDAARTGASS